MRGLEKLSIQLLGKAGLARAQLLLFPFLMLCLFLPFLPTLFALDLFFMSPCSPAGLDGQSSPGSQRGTPKPFLLHYLIHEICMCSTDGELRVWAVLCSHTQDGVMYNPAGRAEQAAQKCQDTVGWS